MGIKSELMARFRFPSCLILFVTVYLCDVVASVPDDFSCGIQYLYTKFWDRQAWANSVDTDYCSV